MKKLPSLVAALLASSLALSSASLTHTRDGAARER